MMSLRLLMACFGIAIVTFEVCNAGTLEDILTAREEACVTYSAEVEYTVTPGGDLRRLSEDYQKFSDWLRAEKPDLAGTAKKTAADLLSSAVGPATRGRYRYFVSHGRQLRIEEYDGASENVLQGEPILHVFSDEHWQDFVPVSRTRSSDYGQLTKHTRSAGNLPPCEVARGNGVPANVHLESMGLINKTESRICQISWTRLLQSVAARAEETSIPLPGGSKSYPALIISTSEWENTGLGTYRATVWFDPDGEFAPIAACCENLEPPNAHVKEYHYSLATKVEWGEYSRSSDGVLTPSHACIRSFTRFRRPEPDVDFEQWEPVTYERLVIDVRFKDVMTNVQLPGNRFEIIPPEGTNVVDELAGERYLVGAAGEKVEASALPPRDGVSGGPPESRWRRLSGVLFSSVIVVLVVLLVWRRHRAR